MYLKLKKSLELKYSQIYLKFIHNVTAIYSMHESIGPLYALHYFSEKLRIGTALMLQATSYIEPKLNIKIFHYKTIPWIYFNRSMKKVIVELIKTGKLRLLIVITRSYNRG